MVISRVIIRVTPFRALITLLITYLLSPLPLQVQNPRPCRASGSPLISGNALIDNLLQSLLLTDPYKTSSKLL